VEDESLVMDIDPRVKIMYAAQMAGDMDKKVAELVRDGHRKEAIALVDEQLALLKDAEKFDDERGLISLLLRQSERMQNKLKDETIDRKLISQGYKQQAHLKQECDDDDMEFGCFT
jgi:hypothetical protein